MPNTIKVEEHKGEVCSPRGKKGLRDSGSSRGDGSPEAGKLAINVCSPLSRKGWRGSGGSWSGDAASSSADTGRMAIIQSMVRQIRNGTPIYRVQLPIFLQEPRSLLERFTDFCSHANLIPRYVESRLGNVKQN